MEVVLTALTLAAPGGMQSYLLTVAPQLERLGHGVTLFAPEQGTMAEVARERGLRVAPTEDDLPADCDAVIAQEGITALAMADRYPHAVRALVVHSAEYDVHLPPAFDGTVTCAIAMNDAVERRLSALAAPVWIQRMRQPIDTDRYRGVGTTPERAGRVLALGNYLNGAGRDALVSVCEASHLSWRQVGVHGDLLADPTGAIADADVVIGQGRSILEGMACGRAAWVYGPIAGDGWVTASSYPALEADGFRGRATDAVLDAGSFARAIEEYDPQMGTANRKLVTLHHSAYEHAISMVGVLERSPAGRRIDAPLRELARVVRTQYHAQSCLDHMTRELRTVLHQRDAARGEIAPLRAEIERIGVESERLRTELSFLEARFERLTASRRWTALKLALSPLDAARRRWQQLGP